MTKATNIKAETPIIHNNFLNYMLSYGKYLQDLGRIVHTNLINEPEATRPKTYETARLHATWAIREHKKAYPAADMYMWMVDDVDEYSLGQLGILCAVYFYNNTEMAWMLYTRAMHLQVNPVEALIQSFTSAARGTFKPVDNVIHNVVKTSNVIDTD